MLDRGTFILLDRHRKWKQKIASNKNLAMLIWHCPHHSKDSFFLRCQHFCFYFFRYAETLSVLCPWTTNTPPCTHSTMAKSISDLRPSRWMQVKERRLPLSLWTMEQCFARPPLKPTAPLWGQSVAAHSFFVSSCLRDKAIGSWHGHPVGVKKHSVLTVCRSTSPCWLNDRMRVWAVFVF